MKTHDRFNKFTQSLINLPIETLRGINGEIIKDAIICIKTKTPFHSWESDVREAQDDYNYTEYDLDQFLSLIQ